MILRIVVKAEPPLRVPLHYKSTLQGLFYRCMDTAYANVLHDFGIGSGGRAIKYFTFSDIQERGRRLGDHLLFESEISFYFASPMDELCLSVARYMEKEKQLLLGNTPVELVSVSCAEIELPNEQPIIVRMLSPIVVYETLYRHDGRKYTHYFTPEERDFALSVKSNLQRKIQKLGVQGVEYMDLQIRPIERRFKQVKSKFKDTVIQGVYGDFLLSGAPQLIHIGLECGFGSKNSGGYGLGVVMKPC